MRHGVPKMTFWSLDRDQYTYLQAKNTKPFSGGKWPDISTTIGMVNQIFLRYIASGIFPYLYLYNRCYTYQLFICIPYNYDDNNRIKSHICDLTAVCIIL